MALVDAKRSSNSFENRLRNLVDRYSSFPDGERQYLVGCLVEKLLASPRKRGAPKAALADDMLLINTYELLMEHREQRPQGETVADATVRLLGAEKLGIDPGKDCFAKTFDRRVRQARKRRDSAA